MAAGAWNGDAILPPFHFWWIKQCAVGGDQNLPPNSEAVDKKGNPIRKFIGNIFKATLSRGERETVDKAEVRKLLNDEDYQKVSRISTYPVLRIS